VTQIAAYLKQNPSVQLGLDGSRNPRATVQRDIDLTDRRVKAVRDALIGAGVPANRMVDGTFGDPELRRDSRVEVLIRTGQLTQGQPALHQPDRPAQVDPQATDWQARSTPQAPTAPAAGSAATDHTDQWSSYREFSFPADQVVIQTVDTAKVAQIAVHLKQNPALQLGIDSSMDSSSATQRTLDLATRRGNAVRDALIAAGVSADRISQGTFGDAELRRDGRVQVLIRDSQRLTQAQ
jgi:outer membrane protein OmpA-like peptidoglycan-associated protein